MTKEEIEYQERKSYDFKSLEYSLNYRIKENERLRKMLKAEILAHAGTRHNLKRIRSD